MSIGAILFFNILFWIHDIFSLIQIIKIYQDREDIIKVTTQIVKLFFFFLPAKCLWIFTSSEAYEILAPIRSNDLTLSMTFLELSCIFEFMSCIGLIITFIVVISIFITVYLESLKYGIKCNFIFFNKIYKLCNFSYDDTNIYYENNKGGRKCLHFSFLTHVLVCFKLNHKNKKLENNLGNEKQQEFYKMVIKDLQEKQNENEKKAQEYLSRAQKNEEDILDNFHKTLELQKKRK